MPNAISCMNPHLKRALADSVVASSAPGEEKDQVLKQLLKVPSCGDMKILMEFYRKGTRLPRPKSAYNLFIGDCMKAQDIHSFGEAPEAMRKCVKIWHGSKEELKRKYLQEK